jgi:excisionase family DNA binding protein
MMEAPYTPETLALRWHCSPQHIRRMLADGRLRGFKLGGKLWRIVASEVARIEEGPCPISDLVGTEESSPPSGMTKETIDSAARSARQIPFSPKLVSSH